MPRGGARPGGGRKKMLDSEKQRIASFTLSPIILAKLDALATESGKSKSMLVEEALNRYLK
jgi:predicted DNA-binding protein